MAGPEPTPLRRRFVTRRDVEDAHAAGQGLTLGPDDVITHEAAQRATDLGVPVSRPERSRPPTAASAAAPKQSGAPAAALEPDRLRAAVRAAVVAELGTEPEGLDAAIDAVLARHRG